MKQRIKETIAAIILLLAGVGLLVFMGFMLWDIGWIAAVITVVALAIYWAAVTLDKTEEDESNT